MEAANEPQVEGQVEILSLSGQKVFDLVGCFVGEISAFNRVQLRPRDHLFDQFIRVGAGQGDSNDAGFRRGDRDRTERRVKGRMTERAGHEFIISFKNVHSA